MKLSLDFSTIYTTDNLLQALADSKVEEEKFAYNVYYEHVNNTTVTKIDSPDHESCDGNRYWEIYKLSNDTGSILTRISFIYSSWSDNESYKIEVVEPYEHTITSYRRV
jgi:hypothetical protein